MADQLSFDLPRDVSFEAGDFFVSAANRAAYDLVTAPDRWPAGKLAIVGPVASGKSHLAAIFAAQLDALVLSAADLDRASGLPERSALVVEDMDRIDTATSQDWLFHAHNHLMRNGGRLLLTADRPATQWPINLPDLASRMQATTRVRIEQPDDALLFAVLSKLFADRQLSPRPETLRYLASRMERSLATAADVVAMMDAKALAEGREINTRLAGAVLDNLTAATP